MSGVAASFSLLILIFLLVMFLGMQVQITGLSRKMDEILEKVTEKK